MNEAGWEGFGGPIRMDRPNNADIDPTLDSCCQREEIDQRYRAVKTNALQRHDVTAIAERRRRNLVKTPEFDGCRCCYDPTKDGGDYPALCELRQSQPKKIDAEATVTASSELLFEEPSPHPNSESEEDSDDEFDYLLDECIDGEDADPLLKQAEERRRLELELAMLEGETILQHGFGVHRQIYPSRVLRAAGLADGVVGFAAVLHLYDPQSKVSAALDLFLEGLATQDVARGTKFLRSEGRAVLALDRELANKVLPRLVRPEQDFPSLIAIRDGVVVNTCPQLMGLTDYESSVDEDAVYRWLDQSGVLISQRPSLEQVCGIRPEEEALMEYLVQQKGTDNIYCDEANFFTCGVQGCRKNFRHQHVGVQNAEQSGLILSEDVIVNN